MAAYIPGLFMRGSSYYLRICLPVDHPLRSEIRNGHLVRTLGQCSYLEAVKLATLRRAEVLCGYRLPHVSQTNPTTPEPAAAAVAKLAKVESPRMRSIYERWVTAGCRSRDSEAACGRALRLFESLTDNPPITAITREMGDRFKSTLQQLPTTSKTARDRFNWLKGLLKYAAQDLELIPKSPWTGLDIKSRTTYRRSPWSEAEIATLLGHPIWDRCALPSDRKAGRWASYWVPLLGMFTGARCSELCQLMTSDIDLTSTHPTIRITDESAGQQIKTAASCRLIPVHPELIRLGFLDYVRSVDAGQLWPELPRRSNKAGGYFSQWFGELRREPSLEISTDFHSFRHTVRSKLAAARVPEPVIDRILGHEVGGSVGAKVYTHVPADQLFEAVKAIGYAATQHLKPAVQRDESINTASPAPLHAPSPSKQPSPTP